MIKEPVSARIAMHVATTFCNCYKFMNLNPSNFRECRDALLNYTAAGLDWEKAPLDWQVVANLCLKPFPKLLPDCFGEPSS